MFTLYDEVMLFYDRQPTRREYRRPGHARPGAFGPLPQDEYEELFLRVDKRRLAEDAAQRSVLYAARLRASAWLAELDCRLRSRVLRQPCAQPVAVR